MYLSVFAIPRADNDALSSCAAVVEVRVDSSVSMPMRSSTAEEIKKTINFVVRESLESAFVAHPLFNLSFDKTAWHFRSEFTFSTSQKPCVRFRIKSKFVFVVLQTFDNELRQPSRHPRLNCAPQNSHLLSEMEDQKCYESMHWIQKSELNAQPVPFSATLNNEDPRSILEVPSDFDALRDSGIVVACTAPDSLLPMQSRHQKNTDSSETADSTPGASLHANLHDEETCGPPPHHVHSHNNAPESSSHEMNDGCNPAAFLTGSDFLPPVASPSSPVNYNSPSIKHKNALQREVEDSCIVEMEGYSMLASPLQESCDKTAPTTSGPLHLPALSPVDDEKSAEQPPMLQPLYDEMHLVAESRDTKIEHVLTEPLLSDVGAGCGVTSIVTHQFDCDEKSDMEQKQIKGSFTAEVKLAPLGSLQVFETCQDQVEALLRGPLSNEVGAPGSSMADLSHSLGSIINHGENAQDMSEVTGLVVEEPAEPMRCVLESMPIPMPSEETPGNFDVTTTVIPMNPSERDPNSDSTKPSVISLHEYVTESVNKDSSDVRGVNDVARREISLDAAMTDFPSVESEGGMDLLPTQHFIRHSFPENASFAFASGENQKNGSRMTAAVFSGSETIISIDSDAFVDLRTHGQQAALITIAPSSSFFLDTLPDPAQTYFSSYAIKEVASTAIEVTSTQDRDFSVSPLISGCPDDKIDSISLAQRNGVADQSLKRHLEYDAEFESLPNVQVERLDMVQKRFRMNDGTRSKNIVECDLEVAEVVECSPTDDVDDSQMDAGRVFSLTECDILQNELSLNALGSAANISTMKVALAPANHEAVEIESKEPFFHINDASTDCLDDPKDTNLEQVVDFSLGCTPSPTRSTVQVDIHSKMSDANLHSSQVVSSSSIDAAPRTNPHSRSLAMEVDVSDNPFYVPVGHADIFGEEEECNELISPSPLSPDPRDRRVVIPISPEGTFDQDAFSFLSPVKLAAVHLKLAEAVRSKKIPHNITIAGIKKQTDVKKEQSAALSVKKENHSTSEKSIMGLLLSPIKGVWQGLGWIE